MGIIHEIEYSMYCSRMHIKETMATIYPDMLFSIWRKMERHLNLCCVINGSPIEPLLKN